MTPEEVGVVALDADVSDEVLALREGELHARGYHLSHHLAHHCIAGICSRLLARKAFVSYTFAQFPLLHAPLDCAITRLKEHCFNIAARFYGLLHSMHALSAATSPF